MNSALFSLQVSLEMSTVMFCFFSIVYLISMNWKSNRWLILIFFIHFWVVFHHMMSGGGFGIIPGNSLFLNLSPLMLFFPALYFYTQDLVKPNNITLLQRLPHFVPFIISYAFLLIVGMDEPLETFTRKKNTYAGSIFMTINLMLVLGYSYFILKLVSINQQKYQNDFASSNPFLTLKWMKWMIYFLIATPMIGIIVNFLLDDYIIVISSVLLGKMILAFFTFRQPILYKEEQLEVEQQKEKSITVPIIQTEKEPTTSWAISDTEKVEYISKIETHFEEAKPYLNPKVRMPELAQTLNIPRHTFSSLINEHYQMNFFNLINQYRVEYAKELLKNKENEFYTLETLGKMAGFNSRTTFNRIFKMQTGVTPRAYQKEAKENGSLNPDRLNKEFSGKM